MASANTFVRYVYEVIHRRDIGTVIDGKGLMGHDLAVKMGEEFADYIDVLRGHEWSSIENVGNAKGKSGTEFVPHTAEESIGVSTTYQETITGATKTTRTKDPNAFPDSQYNQVSFQGNKVRPDVYNDVYKPGFGTTFEAKNSYLDWRYQRLGGSLDNTSAKSIPLMSESAASMPLADAFFGITNSSTFDALNTQRIKQEAFETSLVRHTAAGQYFDLLVNAKGLENDPNTVTLKRVVASFAAVLLVMGGQCSECKNYFGSSGAQSVSSAPDGSSVLNASFTCKFGYTDRGGKAKGPDSFCGTDEVSPANSATQGIRYELNTKVSDAIRSARSEIESGGSDAYKALAKKLSANAAQDTSIVSGMSQTPQDVTAYTGNSLADAPAPVPPSGFPPSGQDPSAV